MKKRFSGESHPNFGKKLGPLSDSHRLAISKGNTGKIRSEEAKQHYRESKLGDKNPMKNISVNHPMYGKHHTKETLKKISNGRKGKCLGASNPSAKAVVCVETGIVYVTIKQAEKSTNCTNISRCCNTGGRSRGLH